MEERKTKDAKIETTDDKENKGMEGDTKEKVGFLHEEELAKEGDLVVVWMGPEKISEIVLEKGKDFQTKYGIFYHEDFMGQKFGSIISARKCEKGKNAGFVHMLLPTPELFTNGAITLRTQIIHTPDISLITFALELGNGSVVVESGTGSGSMSSAIIRVIAPQGFLHTFEFHASRVESAEKEFERHGVAKYVSVKCRDVCAEGFLKEDLREEMADAVFLDLPKPWTAVEHAKLVLKKGCMLASYSPCIEQVQKTCEKLEALGFRGASFRVWSLLFT